MASQDKNDLGTPLAIGGHHLLPVTNEQAKQHLLPETLPMMRSLFTAFLLCTLLGQAHAAAEPRFSSKYTDLSKDCKWAFKESELREGQDNSLSCRADQAYYLGFDFAANTTGVWVSNTKADFHLGTFVIHSPQKGMIEWRMANNKPFAIIIRAAGQNMDGNPGPERLFVRGLIGYEFIEAAIPTKGNNRANEEARNFADGAYLKWQKQ
ncbi:MAG: hypothetical protein WAV95_01810 [Azonexus sp.]